MEKNIANAKGIAFTPNWPYIGNINFLNGFDLKLVFIQTIRLLAGIINAPEILLE